MHKTIDPGKVCEHCGSTLIHPKEAWFCDHCQEKIDDTQYLDSTVFWQNDSDTNRQEFCSWSCFMDWIRNLTLNKKMINFITLPYLGGSAKDFEEEYDTFIQSLTSKVKT